MRFPPSNTTRRYIFVLTATLSFTFALSATLCFKRDFPLMTTRADLKGVTNAAVPLYGSTRRHLMIQGTWVLNRVVYSSKGGAKRTMVKDILSAIDAEIARLEQAKALLSASGAVSAKRKPGGPAKVATLVTPNVQKTRKRGKMSAEGRERVRQAQMKRWAALKGVSKANLNATVAPLPRSKKKAAKAA
jgi:hypothetical protein